MERDKYSLFVRLAEDVGYTFEKASKSLMMHKRGCQLPGIPKAASLQAMRCHAMLNALFTIKNTHTLPAPSNMHVMCARMYVNVPPPLLPVYLVQALYPSSMSPHLNRPVVVRLVGANLVDCSTLTSSKGMSLMMRRHRPSRCTRRAWRTRTLRHKLSWRRHHHGSAEAPWARRCPSHLAWAWTLHPHRACTGTRTVHPHWPLPRTWRSHPHRTLTRAWRSHSHRALSGPGAVHAHGRLHTGIPVPTLRVTVLRPTWLQRWRAHSVAWPRAH